MSKVIGIDLGTTNSVRRRHGGQCCKRRPSSLPTQEGGRTTPSAWSAFSQKRGADWLGRVAKRQSVTNPVQYASMLD